MITYRNGLKVLKGKTKIFPFILAGTVFLTACSGNLRSNNNNSTSSNARSNTRSNAVATPQPATTPQPPAARTLSEKDREMLNARITISEEIASEMLEFLSSIEVTYLHSELFEIERALSQYANMNFRSPASNEIVRNNRVNAIDLYNRVLENNRNHPGNNQIIDNDTLRVVVDILTTMINEKLDGEASIDTNILDHTLKNLKIFEYFSFGRAYVEYHDSVLNINFRAIEDLQTLNPNENMLERIIRHEAIHLIQIDYVNNDQFDYRLGINYSYNNLVVNPLYWEWFVEGSAEKLSLKPGQEPFEYYNRIQDIQTMVLATILNENTTPTTLAELSLQNDLEKFFEHFHVADQQGKEEIIKMMFAYELRYNENEGFAQNYERQNNNRFGIIARDHYAIQTKPSIAQTLTRVFYRNLTKTLVDNSMSLNEIYILISLFETEMNRITRYNDTNREQENEAFLENYIRIQDNFWEMISQENEFSKEQLKDLFTSYHDVYFSERNRTSITIQIEALSNENNEFLQHLSDNRDNARTTNINR